MKLILFLTLCLLGYIAGIVFLIRKLRDIASHPKKYDEIPGYESYRRSFWYEREYRRYGKHYYASLIWGVSFLILGFLGYLPLISLIQKICFLPPGAYYLASPLRLDGCVPWLFFLIGLDYWICYHSTAPICIANTLYAFNSPRRSTDWKKLTAMMLVFWILCFPIIALSASCCSYADSDRIVTQDSLLPVERHIPYASIVSIETGFTTNSSMTEFSFTYEILLTDGTKLDLMEFGAADTLYLHGTLMEHQIPITRGTVDALTSAAIWQRCGRNTVAYVRECYTFLPGAEFPTQ